MPSLLNEHQQFFDETAGVPINNGYIYIGVLGLDPTVLANQITIYSDATLTTPIDNPQRTGTDGRSVNKIYVPNGGYSIEVQDSAGVQKYNNLNAGQSSAGGVSYNISDNSNAVFLTVDSDENSTFAGNITIDNTAPEINILESDSTDKNVEMQLSAGSFSINRRTDADGYVNTFFNYNSNGQLTLRSDTTIPSKIQLVGHRIDLNTTDAITGATGGTEKVFINGGLDVSTETTLKKITETKSALSGTSPEVNLNNGTVFTHTVATSANTFTFTNPGAVASFTLIITNGGSQTVNWPASVDWAGGTAPTLTTSGVDVLTFITPDTGTTWYGFVGGLDMQ